jgi:hypothetical protein
MADFPKIGVEEVFAAGEGDNSLTDYFGRVYPEGLVCRAR